MNNLPLEIENIIWNMYYKDIYSNTIIKEINNIKNDTIDFDINIEYIKKIIRCLRFKIDTSKIDIEKIINLDKKNTIFLEKIKTNYSYKKLGSLFEPRLNNYLHSTNEQNNNLQYLTVNFCKNGELKNNLINYWFINII
jgi:hypothetical protein